MKKCILLVALSLSVISIKAQIVLNEMYTDPGAGNHEFFELFNYGASTSTDNLTLVSYFDSSTTRGFYVLDMPAYTIGNQQYFVMSSALPFNYQGTPGSTASQYNWNDVATMAANGGYLKRWVLGTANLADGNPIYDEQPIPPNFNELFYHVTGGGDPSFSIFLYKNGVLRNTFFGGSNGTGGASSAILAMPALFIDMIGAAPDFTINFPGYSTISSEWYGPQTGTDNGYTRTKNGLCKRWQKAAAGIAHTPGYTNGSPIGTGGEITINASVNRNPTPGDSSILNYNITSGPVQAFPIELISHTDNGLIPNDVDALDTYLTTKTENTVNDGPFQTLFLPTDAQIILMAQCVQGCLDQVIIIPNNPLILPLNSITFQGDMANNKINLKWTVGENEKINLFEVEKSTDGNNFKTIADVPAFAENGSKNYSFSEVTNFETVFYRLKISLKTGDMAYSKTLEFQNKNEQADIQVNNPVNDNIYVSFYSSSNQTIQLSLVDLTGRKVMENKLNCTIGRNTANIPLPATLLKGLYILNISDGEGQRTRKIIKQ